MRMLHWLPAAALALAACDTMAPGDPGNLVPKTVAEDPSLPSLQLRGRRFHAETFGNPNKPAIVFLHGGPGGDYRGLLRLADRYNGQSLEDDYYLIFWDQRGSGLSERVDKRELTIDVFDDDLAAVIDHYAPGRKVFLIGESWGGMYATSFINRHPERVAGAVLIEPGPLKGSTAERIKDSMFDIDLRAEWLNDYVWSHQFISPQDHERMDYEFAVGSRNAQPRFHESRTDPAPSWRLGAAANRYVPEDGQNASGKYVYDFTSNLDAYATPVLFIAGALSEVLGESLQSEQIEAYPSATLKVVAGAGHDVAWVKAADVLTHIRAYLSARNGGAQ